MKGIRKICVAVASLWVASPLYAQDTTQHFSRIVVSELGTVVVSEADQHTVRIENAGKNTHYDIHDETLFLHSRSDQSVAYLTLPRLAGLELLGKGNAKAETTLHTGRLDLKVSGYGKMELPVEATEVHADISGKGNITLSGTADLLDVEIPGAGKVLAAALRVRQAKITITGAGKVETDVADDLDIEITGVGSVKYVSEPLRVHKEISGIGKIGRMDNDTDRETGSRADTTTVNLGDKQIVIISDDGDDDRHLSVDAADDGDGHAATIRYHRGGRSQAHWGGFELGFNNYFSSGFDDHLPDEYDFLELNTGKSVAVNLNFFDWKADLLKHHLAFVTGLGVTWNNWRFSGNRTLIANVPSVSANYDSIDYQKNKLTASYATLPLLLEFNSSASERRSFHVGAGIIMGYRIGSHTKQKFKENDKTRKVKTYDDFNLNPYRYDATVRIGYRGYTFFASYGLAWLFRKNQGPELHPFTFGLTLVNW